jgi:hypothetical protein
VAGPVSYVKEIVGDSEGKRLNLLGIVGVDARVQILDKPSTRCLLACIYATRKVSVL